MGTKKTQTPTMPAEISGWRKVERLPKGILEEIDNWLLKTHFTKYLELTNHVNQLLEKEGLEITVSRSSINRYGRKVQERIEQIHTWTLLAKSMQDLTGDDSAAIPEMNLQLAQGITFAMLLDKGDTLTPDQLAKLTRTSSEAARAYTRVREFQAGLEQRTKVAAKEVAKIGRNAGLSPETIQTIDATILGIAEAQ